MNDKDDCPCYSTLLLGRLGGKTLLVDYVSIPMQVGY